MKFDLAQFRNDPDKVENGTWISVGPGGARWKLRRWQHPKVQSLWSEMVAPRLQDIRRSNDYGELGDLIADFLARAVVLDWEEFYLDGQLVDFDTHAASDLFSKFEELRDQAMRDSRNAEHFRAERLREDQEVLGED